MKVLVVEDEQVAQRALCYLLYIHGHEAAAVGSAEQARQALRSPHSAFDVVLLDVELPDNSGLQLLEEISQLEPRARPVLVTAIDRELMDCVAARQVPYLRKPIDFNQLLGLIDGRHAAN